MPAFRRELGSALDDQHPHLAGGSIPQGADLSMQLIAEDPHGVHEDDATASAHVLPDPRVHGNTGGNSGVDGTG
jgi:hypothetical protein